MSISMAYNGIQVWCSYPNFNKVWTAESQGRSYIIMIITGSQMSNTGPAKEQLQYETWCLCGYRLILGGINLSQHPCDMQRTLESTNNSSSGSWKMLKATSPKLSWLLIWITWPTRSLRLEVKHQNNPQLLPNLHVQWLKAWWNLLFTPYRNSASHHDIPESLRHQVEPPL